MAENGVNCDTTARKLLADAKRVGIILSANGGRLAFDAPAGAMTPDLRARLVACKAELLAVLAGEYVRAAAALIARMVDESARDDLAYRFDERAAIVEFESGKSRGGAERQAYIELTRAVEGGYL